MSWIWWERTLDKLSMSSRWMTNVRTHGAHARHPVGPEEDHTHIRDKLEEEKKTKRASLFYFEHTRLTCLTWRGNTRLETSCNLEKTPHQLKCHVTPPDEAKIQTLAALQHATKSKNIEFFLRLPHPTTFWIVWEEKISCKLWSWKVVTLEMKRRRDRDDSKKWAVLLDVLVGYGNTVNPHLH